MQNKNLRLCCCIQGAARRNSEKDTRDLDAKLKDKVTQIKWNKLNKMVKENPSNRIQISMRDEAFFELLSI